MSYVAPVVMALAVAVATTAGAGAALHYLRRRQIVDLPNERSSHSRPTPRGLGIAVVPVVLLGWLAIAALTASKPTETWWICAGACALAVVSWIDDFRGLPVAPRLLVQVVVVVVGVVFFAEPRVLQSAVLPVWIEKGVMIVLWLGLINQVNFTDGIDGNLGTALACVCGGLFVVTWVAKAPGAIGSFSLTLAGGALGFLVYNWPPAKAFMGDVGSVPLGYLAGWLLLRTASYGLWLPVIILPLFYFADTAVTYSRRIARRTKFWKPHREYLYQRAARATHHAHVVSVVALCNAVLLCCAVLAVHGPPWVALVGALGAVFATYAYLARGLSEPSSSTKG